MTRKISLPARVPARRIKEVVPPTYGEIIIVIRLFRMLQEGRTEQRGRIKERREREGEEKRESCWMDHGFLWPSGVYSVDEALVIAVDARVLMDMPDADRKKKNVASLGVGLGAVRDI